MSDARCRVCGHAQRIEIDRELVAGLSNTSAGERFGLSKDSVRRHRASHLSAGLKAVQTKRETQGVLKASDRLEDLYGRARGILDAAEGEGQSSLALNAVKELRGLCMDLARLTGEYDDKPQVQILNVTSDPQWLHTQAAMLQALAPYPEARVAVASALEDLGELS